MSYRDQFDEYLHDLIRAGGEVDRICVAAAAFLGHDAAVRRELFRDWVGRRSLVCEGCLEDFTVESVDLDEDAAVHCAQCVAWWRGYRSARGGPVAAGGGRP